jgi:hypothetical protein
MRRSLFVFCVSLLWFAAPAAAQKTYVGGSFLGEFARFGGVDIDDDDNSRRSTLIDDLSRNDESVGFDVRLGRGLGERWGIELAFARGGSAEQVQSQRLLGSGGSGGITLPGLPVLPILPIPEIEIERRLSQQHTTIDTVAWFQQNLSDRVGLTFLGGVSFNRTSTEQSFRLTDDRLTIDVTYPAAIETVQYGVGPVAGAETSIAFGAHAAITAGVRLHGVSSGWLIRPAAGIRWTF